MVNYGYDIIKALVADIDPDGEVKTAMNKSMRRKTKNCRSVRRGCCKDFDC